MSETFACPTCHHDLAKLPAIGEKITCPSCRSLHRVRENEKGVYLHVLIEAVPATGGDPEPATEEAAAAEDPPARFKLKTWKDKAREQDAQETSTTRRSNRTVGSRRRRVR